MKRNYTKAIFTSAFTVFMLASGILASAAGGWQVIRDGKAQTAPVKKSEMSPFEKYRKANGIVTSMARIQPAKDGIQPTPKISQRPANILRSPEEPRGNIYGVFTRYEGMTYNTDAFLGQINLTTGAVTPKNYGAVYCPYTGEDYLLQTNAYRNGYLYCPSYTINEADGSYGAVWSVVDVETNEIVQTIRFNDSLANVYTLTYNPDNDKFYGVAIDVQRDGFLVEIDAKTLDQDVNPDSALTSLTNLRDERCLFVGGLCYNPNDGMIYGFNNDNRVFMIDVFKGTDGSTDVTVMEAGEVNYDRILIEEGITAQVCYSPTDQMYIFIYRDNDIQANKVLYIDPDSFDVYEGTIISQMLKPFISAIYCTDDFAEPDAPDMVTEPVINFVNESLSGIITFQAPEYTYVGIELGNTPVKVVATIDGKEVFNESVTPGKEIRLEPTLEEGLHLLEITASIGENASPVRKVAFPVGYDTPKAPTNLRLSGTTLTWNAPAGIGENKGYVVPANFTYDVYLNGVKQNSEPITGTSFTITPPANQTKCNFEVTASANGHTSVPAKLIEVFGQALTLPFSQRPTKEESELYRVINNNNDGRVWFWTDETGMGNVNGYGWAMSVGYTDDADDWLIFPLINFPSKDYLYTLDFDLVGMMYGVKTIESYEIYLGKEPTVKSMFEGTNIYSDNYFEYYEDAPVKKHQTINFAVKEAGDYYIAFRINSKKEDSRNGQGLILNEINVQVAEGKSTAVPADPIDVKIIPNEFGETRFEAIITLPLLDITGTPLPADDEITMTLQNGRFNVTGKGKPGETISISMSLDSDGFANILFTPSNENGTGYPRAHRAYIGIDTPFCPTEITGIPTADNLGINLAWKAPGAVGVNGGFVPVDELKYNIYIKSGISLAKVGETTDTKYSYSPFSGDHRPLTTYYVGPSAVTEGGESQNSLFIMEDLGDPYELPMNEEWGGALFNYTPYTFATGNQYQGSDFQSVTSMNGMGIDDPIFVEAGIIGTSNAGLCKGQLTLPKATTKGVQKVIFQLRYWDYKDAPDVIEVYGRRNGHEDLELLKTINMNRPAKGEWVDAEIALPAEYCDNNWIQLRLGTNFTGALTEYLVLDSYKIIPDADYDLKVTKLTGPTQISIGDVATYNITVANSGRERMDGSLLVELLDAENNVLATDETWIAMLNSTQTFEHQSTFDINGEFADLDKFTIRVTANTDIDENTSNNVKSLPVKIMGSQLPVVKDLKGEINSEQGVDLNWSTPATEYGNYDNIEVHTPFQVTDKIGLMKNYDFDKLPPITLENGAIQLKWEGSDQPQGWTVVDMEQLGLMNDSRIAPHSGKQVLIARCGDYPDQEQPVQSDKWLVLPQVKGGTKLGFWMSTLSNQYTEYLEIWYSATNDNLALPITGSSRYGSFQQGKKISKSGEEDWEYIEYDIPRLAKYVAIRFDSWDGTAVVIDDISFTPAEMQTRELSHYSLWRADDGKEPVLVADNLTGNSYTDTEWPDSKAYYHLLAHAKVGDEVKAGPKSNSVFINGTSVAEIEAAHGILGGVGQIRINNLAGEDLVIATADGKVVKNGKVTSAQAYYGLEKGIYVVTAGNITAKVVVK